MSQRVLGFVLVSVAIIGTFLAFTLSNYTAQAGFAWNLQNAYVLREQVYCPEAPQGLLGTNRRPSECPRYVVNSYYVKRDGLSLGLVLTGTAAVALAGVGLVAYGKSGK